MTPVKVISKKARGKKSKIDAFSKKCNALGKFGRNRYGKTKKNRLWELREMVTKKNQGIRSSGS